MNNEENTKKSKIAEREEAILKYWRENKIFEKSLALRQAQGKEFIFYDGPPFATGLPHYGHILAGTLKDVIPRYKTMRGYYVPRRWGWDCHGLPVENIVEKELGFKTKKDIENFGIANFNKKARESVMQFADDWRTIVPRLGRFVDMDNDYRTMDSTYTESVWWAFKNLYDKGLIYEGFKSMHICPHCETTLSNFEVTQGYKDVTDISVYTKFKLKDEPNTYLVAWTTTPWTLPGNTALAINKDIVYCKVQNVKIKNQNDNSKSQNEENEILIIAKDRLSSVFKNYDYKITEELKGKDLVGLEYEPVFDYYAKDEKLKNRENGWKIYAGDFVTTEDGTGVVHIAPAFGEDDYQMSLKEKLPFVQHVSMDGKFKAEVKDPEGKITSYGASFAGMSVKPKDDPQRTDIEIIKYLAAKNLLFGKEKITHPYPHCWRCETPLLNYATSSWFVKVTAFKDKLVSENEKISWIPEQIGKYRFGNWLSEARDWAISRSRFWGAPIPVWRCGKCGQIKVVGSLDDIKTSARNKFFVVRHGEAENNVLNIVSSNPNLPHHLTENGKAQVLKSAGSFKKEKVDFIFHSPNVRTTETAEILAKELGMSSEKVITDSRVRETGKDAWDGKSVDEYHKAIGEETDLERFTSTANNAESFNQIRKRVGDFLYETDKKYQGKTIVIVTHDTPIWMLFSDALGFNPKQAISFRGNDEFYFKNAGVKELRISYVPKNDLFELDLHRPYIDSVEFDCKCGGHSKRVPEVFDCWFESGSMSYASNHYPFEKENFDPQPGFLRKSKRYPANFIAEGVDQTRGWFYSMLVLGTALFGKTPYENVVVNGIILAENGEKMSKRLQNYPDPMALVERYGADSLRYYLLSSPAVKAEDIQFSERGVDEVSKKIISRLDNVLSFYLLYKDSAHHLPEGGESPNVLDVWIKARLGETAENVTKSMEKYEIDRAARPLLDFIEDLSVWYLRRSRERIKKLTTNNSSLITEEEKKDAKYALATLKFVLAEFSKILAPFMPFLAEHIYQSLLTTNYLLPTSGSVHLENWPIEAVDYIHHDILKDMKNVREVVSVALELRAKAGIKVRQPLLTLRVKRVHDSRFTIHDSELIQLIKDEVNVKHIHFSNDISSTVELDSNITPELREEGQIRELIRAIQEARKNEGLTIKDQAELLVETDEAGKKLFEKNKNLISKATLLRAVSFGSNLGSEPIDVGEGRVFRIKVLK